MMQRMRAVPFSTVVCTKGPHRGVQGEIVCAISDIEWVTSRIRIRSSRGARCSVFIAVHRDEIIKRCRAKVAGRPATPPTEAEIDHGVSVSSINSGIRSGQTTSAAISRSALKHGHDLPNSV